MPVEEGDRVLIKQGPFQGYEGTVSTLVLGKGLIRVLITVFGRQVPVEVEVRQLNRLDEK